VKRNVIAIDGPAGSGKSTIARSLASTLGWTYLDTGAMYRAVTSRALELGLPLSHEAELQQLAAAVQMDTAGHVFVDDIDVSQRLRSPAVNEAVSAVAAMPGVRDAMVERQRAFVERAVVGVVVEGRDITTVVFPDARLKVFLTASLEERARRRGEEGAASIERRDEVDSTRAHSPLRQAEDAVVVDTTGLSVVEVTERIVQCLENTTWN
jgi:cytidylate kinase